MTNALAIATSICLDLAIAQPGTLLAEIALTQGCYVKTVVRSSTEKENW